MNVMTDGTLLACTTAVTLVWDYRHQQLSITLAQTNCSTPNSYRLNSRQHFYVVFWSSCCCDVGAGDRSFLSAVLGHFRQWTVCSAWQQSVWDVALSGDHYSGGTLHTGDSTWTQQAVDHLQCLAALSLRCCFSNHYSDGMLHTAVLMSP